MKLAVANVEEKLQIQNSDADTMPNAKAIQ